MIAPGESNYGIVIAGHGSRDPEGVRQFEQLVEKVKEGQGSRPVTYGFLEFATPTIDEAIRSNLEHGVDEVAVVPAMLLGAAHAKNDIPVEVLSIQKELSKARLHYATPLQLHPSILKLCREKIIHAEATSPKTMSRDDTCLVVVGRGTTDPDANSEVFKLSRLLQEGLGFGGVSVCFSGTAKPLVADGLKQAARLGFPRLLVFPFFLFTGVLMNRIYAAADDSQLMFPEIEILKADHLGADSRIGDVVFDRAREAIEGKAAMNCSQCKYRTQIIGYEREMGKPQMAHHFHVRALNRRSSDESTSKTVQPESETVTKNEAGHAIESESFERIRKARDWGDFSESNRPVLQRLVHTTGDLGVADEIYISPGAVEAGVSALQRRSVVVTDVTMVQSGIRRALISYHGLKTECFVHDEETYIMAEAQGLTRSAAGIRRAWQQFGNEVVLAIGDAPTAVEEAVRLVREQRWRPALVIGLPVGFVGTEECKQRLRRCLQVSRITNRGTKGGSPWAASVVNALLLQLEGTGIPA